MAQRWFYTRDGKTHGPFTVEELKRLAAQGQLDPSDLLWPEGSEPQVELVPLTPVLPAPGPASATPPEERPEWLSDVELVEQAKPKPPVQPRPPSRPKPPAQQPQPPSSKPTSLPDWLDDVQPGEQP